MRAHPEVEFLSALRVPRGGNDRAWGPEPCLHGDMSIFDMISSTREYPGYSTLAHCGLDTGDVPTPGEIEGRRRPDWGWDVPILPPRRSGPTPRLCDPRRS